MKNNPFFKDIKGRVLFNEPLSRHTTFRIGGPCSVWFEPSSLRDLKKILSFAKKNRKKAFIIGNGSNVLFRDEAFDGIIIRLASGYFRRVRQKGARVTAGAGVSLASLVDLACKKGLSGVEGLVGIPGTLGGAVFMNSSYRGKISDCIENVKVMDRSGDGPRVIKKDKLKFGYRRSNLDKFVILEATLRLKRDKRSALAERKKTYLEAKMKEQPLGSFTAGCVFKNPRGAVSAARYMDMSDLKGKRIGRAEISRVHANFVVNLKGARYDDVARLIEFAKKRVKARFDVTLVPEIKVL